MRVETWVVFVYRKILIYCKILLFRDMTSCTLTDISTGEAWRREDDTDSSETTVYFSKVHGVSCHKIPVLIFTWARKTQISCYFRFKIVFLYAFVSCFEIFCLLTSYPIISANDTASWYAVFDLTYNTGSCDLGASDLCFLL